MWEDAQARKQLERHSIQSKLEAERLRLRGVRQRYGSQLAQQSVQYCTEGERSTPGAYFGFGFFALLR